jgi:hypothetical protein
MNLKPALYLFFICAFSAFSSAQNKNKKDIKKNKIKSIAEFASIIENGKETTFKVSYTAFDKNGKSIEETEFNKDGSIQKKGSTKYDSNDNKIEETNFRQKEAKATETGTNAPTKANLNTRITCKYNANNDKTEENIFDAGSGKLISKQVYTYNGKGEKSMETTFDETTKLIKKALYTYNNKSLKTEKKIYNGENVLQETKKYVYEFY